MLPVLLSIPHGSLAVPPELDGRLAVTAQDIFWDGDAFTGEIYGLDSVAGVLTAGVARIFVDLNRSLSHMPPDHPDGLIKSVGCDGAGVYAPGMEPDPALRRTLVERYYMPYHRRIQRATRDLDLQLCLDCHSMANSAPKVSPARNRDDRPLFCLSNRDGESCSGESLELLARCISGAYNISRESIRLNDPFRGGHITKTYGNNPVPWIQVEMNRSMYLSGEWFDSRIMECSGSRLEDLRRMFGEALESYFAAA